MELVWSGRNDPAAFAIALAAYSALTVLGMALFGRQKWLTQGEMSDRNASPTQPTIQIMTGAMLRIGSWLPNRPATITSSSMPIASTRGTAAREIGRAHV